MHVTGMPIKELFVVELSALSLLNKNSRDTGATSRATPKKSFAKKSNGVPHLVILVSLV